ncbi:serine/threonine-protein kinase, partial [Ideonella sp. A 288]|uniref:serine/threonine protein kinase n=1 Tax=Ideonella sp. A 288 TaxID=1962181 RepID=UPI001F281BB4
MASDPTSGNGRRMASVLPDVDLDGNSPTVGNKLAVGLRLDEYEISGVIGEGGFGIVYLAWDHSLQRRLAIKEYMPASLAWRSTGLQVEVRGEEHVDSFTAGLRSFINEAKLLARFDHPSLLKVHRFWQANGTAYMVMPYYEGPTVKQELAAREQRPDEGWLRALLSPLLDALEYLHAASCYHRDIAPDNILLIDGGRPLLLDFGAARRLIGDMSKSATVILKSGYAPIEQYGEMPGLSQGPWTDIYALGAVLHYAITGKVPRASVSRLLRDDEVPLAVSAAGRYSERLLRTVDRMLAVQPSDRPQSIAEVRQLLGPDRAPRPAQAPAPTASHRRAGDERPAPAPAPVPMPATPRRWGASVGLVLAGAVLAAAAGGLWQMLSHRAAPTTESASPVREAAPSPDSGQGRPEAAPKAVVAAPATTPEAAAAASAANLPVPAPAPAATTVVTATTPQLAASAAASAPTGAAAMPAAPLPQAPALVTAPAPAPAPAETKPAPSDLAAMPKPGPASAVVSAPPAAARPAPAPVTVRPDAGPKAVAVLPSTPPATTPTT